MKEFHASDSPDHPCKLAKSVGGKWLVADGSELSGQQFAASVSKANGDFSNFKYNGTWYAVRTECLQDAGSGSSGSEGSADSSNAGKKYYAELRAQKYLMMGAGAGGGPNGTAGQTNSPLASSLGIGARLGYYWKEDKIIFLDINTLSAAQTTTYVGSPSGTTAVADSILMINVGLQMPFKTARFGFIPYVAGSLGYAKFTETFAGTLAPGGAIAIADSASTFNVKLEGGGTYRFTQHLDGVLSLAYTYLNIANKNITASNYPAPALQVGSSSPNSLGYSHLTVGFGIRYTL